MEFFPLRLGCRHWHLFEAASAPGHTIRTWQPDAMQFSEKIIICCSTNTLVAQLIHAPDLKQYLRKFHAKLLNIIFQG